MNQPCPTCGTTRADDGKCPNCDVEVEIDLSAADAGERDPLIGAIIADRYEILKLQGVGGMARVYRALQRSLNRDVVVKVINPELLAEGELTAEEAVARFFVEAQAASKLNHPNVVSVYDFGRTRAADGGLLFLVLEFLSGSDLWTVHHADLNMPFARVANILQQTLAALGEAHYLGIAHRDVKPENILVEATRGGRDLVKVIDFGLAKLGGLQTVTRAGQTVGTPHYMAPEQIAGEALGSGDLYAVGVILFELLTGVVPFDGANPIEILRKHIAAPRPDPRQVAPAREIPAALAEVCIRAMAIDPKDRWPDAESLAAAIGQAAGSVDWSRRASVPPPAQPRPADAKAPSPPARPSMPPLTAPRAPTQEALSLTSPLSVLARRTAARARPAGPPTSDNAPLLGRDADVAWANARLSGAAGVHLDLHGEPGVGRSRLLREIEAAAAARGQVVVHARAGATPARETSYGALRRVVAALARLPVDHPSLAAGDANDGRAAAGLLAIFSSARRAATDGARDARDAAAAAFAWAARGAVEAAGGAGVVLSLDDVDALDNASRMAVLDGFAAAGPRFFLVTTAQRPASDDGQRRALRGLAQADAGQLHGWLGGAQVALRSGADGIEPVFVELLRRFRLDGPSARGGTLLEVVELALTSLSPAQRRLVLVVAVTGGGTRAELRAAARPADVDVALDRLVEAGVFELSDDGVTRITHDLIGRVAIAMAPSAAVEELHTAAAIRLADRPALEELRAHHAVHGTPDFETFMLVEGCAAHRAALGDDEGAIEALKAGTRAGQTLVRHGEVEAGGSACVVFGRKLGATLDALGRHDEALAVLKETLEVTEPGGRGRLAILGELIRASGALGQLRDADRFRREAITIARALGERELVQRLVDMARE